MIPLTSQTIENIISYSPEKFHAWLKDGLSMTIQGHDLNPFDYDRTANPFFPLEYLFQDMSAQITLGEIYAVMHDDAKGRFLDGLSGLLDEINKPGFGADLAKQTLILVQYLRSPGKILPFIPTDYSELDHAMQSDAADTNDERISELYELSINTLYQAASRNLYAGNDEEKKIVGSKLHDIISNEKAHDVIVGRSQHILYALCYCNPDKIKDHLALLVPYIKEHINSDEDLSGKKDVFMENIASVLTEFSGKDVDKKYLFDAISEN